MSVKSSYNALFVAAALVLTGCTSPKPFDFSLNRVPVAKVKLPYRLTNVSVNVESSGAIDEAAYGTRPPGLENLVQPLKNSIQDAVDKSAMFDYNSRKFCALDVKIIGIKRELAGMNFSTTLYVRYSIVNLNSGRPIFNEIVPGFGTTPLGYNFFGAIRSRHSVIKSGKEDVKNFIFAAEQFSFANFSGFHDVHGTPTN